MKITYRPSEREDCAKLAELINIASGGVVQYLFHGLVPGMTPVQIVGYNLEKDYYPHSYKSAIVALDGNTVVGMALSYPSSYHTITDEMRSYFPEDRIKQLQDYYSSRVNNSWFLDALCVTESHRRYGIGEKLISLTKEYAIVKGYHTLSLMVFADNTLAIPLYEHTGFEIVQHVELRENEFIKHENGCLLMKCKITT